MKKEIYGWCGKILKVDLSDSIITELDTMEYAERFLGGRGIATRIYYEEVGPEVGALDPDNYLILMSGPLTATGAQGSPRFEVVGKSPMLMPEGFCYGNIGGFFAPYLKRAGYDGIAITGRAKKPSYIWIQDGRAEIRDASFLWGKGIFDVRSLLRERHGARVRFVTTGMAGENRCRNATLIADHEGGATGGFGAVIGSKNLKAIAVDGTGRPSVARPDDLVDLNRLTIKLSKRGILRMPVPQKFIRFVKTAPCYQCGMNCGKGLYKTPEGREIVRKCQSLIMYMPWVFAREGEKIDSALNATDICNDYSICTMEMSNILSWLEACYQSGYLTDDTTGLEFSKIGSYEFIERLVTMIAKREGFGDTLAEGLLRAGELLGEEAKSHFTEFVSGVGLGAPYAPRLYNINALFYALEPRQPIAMLHDVSHLIARWLLHRYKPKLSPTTAEVFRSAATKFWGSNKAWDLTTYEGKAIATVMIQNRTYLKDSLPLCDFAWPIMDSFNTDDNTGDPTLKSKIFSAVTGIETDEEGLSLYAERIFNLQRAILLREGWHAKEDDVPAEFNFTKPLESDHLNPEMIVPGPTEEPVSIRGNVLNREKFEEMRKDFYELRGWDPETGLQKIKTLRRLDLDDVADDLIERGLAK